MEIDMVWHDSLEDRTVYYVGLNQVYTGKAATIHKANGIVSHSVQMVLMNFTK